MTLHRFYVPDLGAGPPTLDADESAHARRVLRLTEGDRVELFDGRGTIASATIRSIRSPVSFDIAERRTVAPPAPAIDLAVAMPKGDRAATLIEKASELAADRLIPLRTERSVVDPGKGKRQRFDRIAIESAKQCGRAHLMAIAPTTPLADLLRTADHDLKLLADPSGDSTVQILHADDPPPQRLIVLIGPEGGWTDDERNAAKHAGFIAWRFAEHILRIETAALAALAILRART